MPIESYKPSGRFSPLVFAVMPVLAIASGVIGGFVYQTLIDIIPFILLGAGLTLLFGLGVGAVAGAGVRLGKCRNKLLAAVLGALVGLMALGFSYYWAYLSVASKFAPIDAVEGAEGRLTFNDYIDARVASGWTVSPNNYPRGNTQGKPWLNHKSESTWSGGMVYLIWLIEAAVVVGCAAFAPIVFTRQPFCEGCNRWAKPVKLGVIHSVDQHKAIEAAMAGEWQGLLQPVVEGATAPWLEYTLQVCPRENEPKYLDVVVKWKELDGKKEVVRRQFLVVGGLVTLEQVELLKQSIANPRPAARAKPQTASRPTNSKAHGRRPRGL